MKDIHRGILFYVHILISRAATLELVNISCVDKQPYQNDACAYFELAREVGVALTPFISNCFSSFFQIP